MDSNDYFAIAERLNNISYRPVDSLFDELEKHVVARRRLIEKPCIEDGTLISAKILFTLDDGMEVELCRWTWEHIDVWDVSIDKKRFDTAAPEDFVAYLADKGVYTESVRDRFNNKWRFAGRISCDNAYRVQYTEME